MREIPRTQIEEIAHYKEDEIIDNRDTTLSDIVITYSRMSDHTI
jgi:hypothetical protein